MTERFSKKSGRRPIVLYARADSPATAQLITASAMAAIGAGLAITLFQYRKHVERCKDLLEQFEEQ